MNKDWNSPESGSGLVPRIIRKEDKGPVTGRSLTTKKETTTEVLGALSGDVEDKTLDLDLQGGGGGGGGGGQEEKFIIEKEPQEMTKKEFEGWLENRLYGRPLTFDERHYSPPQSPPPSPKPLPDFLVDPVDRWFERGGWFQDEGGAAQEKKK